MKKSIKGIGAVLALWLSGCGTVHNCWSISSKQEGGAYGGVKTSLLGVKVGAKEAVSAENGSDRAFGAAMALYCVAIDAPLSAALDTAMLPITLFVEWDNAKRKAERQAPVAASVAESTRSEATEE